MLLCLGIPLSGKSYNSKGNCWPIAEKTIKAIFERIETMIVRDQIIKEGKRPDGRGLTNIRPISCEVGILPRTHGSALFTRGETQAIVVTTRGTTMDEQREE